MLFIIYVYDMILCCITVVVCYWAVLLLLGFRRYRYSFIALEMKMEYGCLYPVFHLSFSVQNYKMEIKGMHQGNIFVWLLWCCDVTWSQ